MSAHDSAYAPWLPLVVSVVGLVLYLACNTPGTTKISEAGRWAFVIGLLVWLLVFARAQVRL